jgi:hypothetical protein
MGAPELLSEAPCLGAPVEDRVRSQGTSHGVHNQALPSLNIPLSAPKLNFNRMTDFTGSEA